jgi:hypothetical protein
MPESMPLAKAKLIELKDDWSGKNPDGLEVVVQFNPESLKVTYSNQVVPPQVRRRSSSLARARQNSPCSSGSM